MARSLVSEWPREAEELAQRWWPGPLTLVLRSPRGFPASSPRDSLPSACALPSHPVALELIEAAGLPLAAPSGESIQRALSYHRRPCTSRVRRHHPRARRRTTRVGIESTVVSIADGKITPPASRHDRARENWNKRVAPAVSNEGGAHPSPGMAARHYSPRTPLMIVNIPSEMPDRRGAYVWWNTSGLTARSVRMPRRSRRLCARRLYSVLHDLDQENWPWIAVEAPPRNPRLGRDIRSLKKGRVEMTLLSTIGQTITATPSNLVAGPSRIRDPLRLHHLLRSTPASLRSR